MSNNIQFNSIIKKAVITLARLIGFSFLAILAISISAPIINDNIAKKTANTLIDITLPNDTEYIETVYIAGKLVGNGNGMQYFGAILLKSNLSLEDLKKYYSDYAKNEWECIVEQQKASEISIIENTPLAFKTNINNDNYYIVYSWGENHTIFHEFDLRGH